VSLFGEDFSLSGPCLVLNWGVHTYEALFL